ncbi:hypothetical protein [Scleromatobacter humisilvae]|nr:hypothetical protein [Scleromatobacter humisilvae]
MQVQFRPATLSLRVFGHKVAARAPYERLGYAATSLTMSKPLR